MTTHSKEELREIFDHFDADHNNRIDRQEFRRLVQEGLQAEMDVEELDVGFRAIDRDGNGTIEFDEFAAWWRDQ
jgi:calmodulin